MYPGTGRPNEVAGIRSITIEIDRDGNIVLPRGGDFDSFFKEVARSMGDASAMKLFEETDLSCVLIGKRRCG